MAPTPILTIAGLILWGLILLAQNASFTMVSRARNSGSDWYHAWAAVASNGVWFVAFYFTFGYLDLLHTLNPLSSLRDLGVALAVTAAYIVPTVTGSVLMGKFLRKFLERGKRRVGHYDDKAQRLDQLEDQVRLMARILERSTAGSGGPMGDELRDAVKKAQGKL